MQWDVFCRVIDNFGDIGVCWRLAADLASRGDSVRLFVDDARALSWMAPHGAVGVNVHAWPDAEQAEPAEVVIEAFGCEPPAAFISRMAARPRAPHWINLEYLSAEGYVERSHRLPSPQLSGPGRGLTKWFFYPGFTPATGGLLREPGLVDAQQQFDRAAGLRAQGITPAPSERVISVFAYPQAPLDALAALLSDRPALLLLTPGAPVPQHLPTNCRIQSLAFLDQPGYDRLLWSCDLNLVRGEDSFVRAQWAGRPFVWHIYPQDDGAHATKLQAFLDRFTPPPGVRELWAGWNGLAPMPEQWPAWEPWAARCQAWREELGGQKDLVSQLRGFVAQ